LLRFNRRNIGHRRVDSLVYYRLCAAIFKGGIQKIMQGHHITNNPEWVVELNGWEHKAISTVQRRKASAQNYAKTANLMHAL
jgi:hypothetical protein